MKIRILAISILFFLTIISVSHAAHPLITDDTGTQGAGNFQLEANVEYNYDKEEGITIKETGIGFTLSYGIKDNIDLQISMPYQIIKETGTGSDLENEGMGDLSFDVKWRIYEKDAFSLLIKPGITLPTGDEDKGLGSGKTGYKIFLVSTFEKKPYLLHTNIGYILNKNKLDERESIWHISAAGEYFLTEGFRVVGNIGMERNADKSSSEDPAFFIAGIIYGISKNFDVDLGIKLGLNKQETDRAFLAGIALRF